MESYYIQWAINKLLEERYKVNITTPDIIQDNPWSTVYRFATDRGFVFLKKVPPALSIEPRIINILHNKFRAHVPKIIAINNEQHCFLMHDAGIQLHKYFKDNFKMEILIQTVQEYVALQINSSKNINLFLDIGVPDWRLEKLPTLYNNLIAEESLLIDDGLTKDELIQLRKLEPKLSSICEKLSQYKINETFCHADYHDKNILIDTDTLQTTLIDLGEVLITHPFFSFLNCFYRAKQNFLLSDSQYQQLQLECFKPWLEFETQENLFEIFGIIQQCWSIHAVLGEFRLLNSVDPLAFQTLRRQGRLANNLRYWIQSGIKYL